MDSQREAFEKYRNERNARLAAEGHTEGGPFWVNNTHYPTWQAATEQGVGEAVAEVTGRDEFPGTFVGYELNGYGASIGDKLYRHPPKPTDGDLTIDDYKEAFESHQRMVRQLDVLINGEEGAARQASLCDLVSQIEKEGLTVPSKPTDKDAPECFMRLYKHARGLSFGQDWNKGTVQSHHRRPLIDAVIDCEALLARQQRR